MASEEDSMTLDAFRGLTAAEVPAISAGRFALRPPRPSDAAPFALYAGDHRVAEATQAIPHPLPQGWVDAFLARTAAPGGEEETWIIDGTSAGLPEVLGSIGLKKMDRGQSEVSFWVAPAFWNLGIASEALAALIAANPQRNVTLFAAVFQDSAGSARVLTNNGFAYIGDAESFSVARGAHVPTWTYVRKLG